MNPVFVHSAAAMGTVVSIQVVGGNGDRERRHHAETAMAWFRELEGALSRFDPHSELRRLTTWVGAPVAVSPMLVAVLEFALALAEETGGAFDPTVGRRMEAAGFNLHFRTGERSDDDVPHEERVSWRDVTVDRGAGTVTLHRPLRLDLGAVAKGMAIDLAARELAPLGDFAIDAGGDLYFGGRNADGMPWRVGIRHPRVQPGDPPTVIETLVASDMAVCTSGDYERVTAAAGGDGIGAAHHLLDPRTGQVVRTVASVTVMAPTAMASDALATAGFVLGPADGIALLERHGVEGLFLNPALDRHVTRAWPGTPSPNLYAMVSG